MSLKVEFLAESFDFVLSQKEPFAKTYYSNLFSAYPQTCLLFTNTDMKRQDASLIAALGVVISSLKKADHAQLAAVLQTLGWRHEGYGVTREQYRMVGNVLMKTFSEFFGNLWIAELNDAWTDVYQAVVGLMQPIAEPSGA